MSCTSIPVDTLYSTPTVVETITVTTITVYTSPGTVITVPYTTTSCSSISSVSDPVPSDPVISDGGITSTVSSVEPVTTDPPITTEAARTSEAAVTSDEIKTTDAPATSDEVQTTDAPVASDAPATANEAQTTDAPVASDAPATADQAANSDGGPTQDGGNNSAEVTAGAARRRRQRYPRQLQSCIEIVTSSLSTLDSQLITSPLVIQGLTTIYRDPVAVETQYSVTCPPEPGPTVTAVVTVTPEVTTPQERPTSTPHENPTPTVTVIATVVSVSNVVSTLLIPSTLWRTSSTISSSAQPSPVVAAQKSSNVGMIAGAIAAAVVVLAAVLGLIFYFKCFRRQDPGRGSHIVDLGPPPTGLGAGFSSAAIAPEKAPSLHPFTVGGGGIQGLTLVGGGAGSSSSGGGGSGVFVQEKGAIAAAHNAAPVIVAGGAKRRESDYGQPTLPVLLRNASQQHHSRSNTELLLSSSGSQRQSSVEGTTITDPTSTMAPSSEKASVYFDPRMSGKPLLADTPSNEGSTHRDSVTSSILSSPGHRRGRPLPTIPGKISSSSPTPDSSITMSPNDRASMLGTPIPRPFSSESRPMSPMEQPPPSYDEAERVRLSYAGNNRGQQ